MRHLKVANLHFLLSAEARLGKVHVKVKAQVIATLRPSPRLLPRTHASEAATKAAAAATAAAKKRIEDVRKINLLPSSSASWGSCGSLDPALAKHVIPFALIGITEHFVCAVHLLPLVLGCRVDVRMADLGLFAKCRFDVPLISALGNPEVAIKIRFLEGVGG